jgi:hypothetical protein
MLNCVPIGRVSMRICQENAKPRRGIEYITFSVIDDYIFIRRLGTHHGNVGSFGRTHSLRLWSAGKQINLEIMIYIALVCVPIADRSRTCGMSLIGATCPVLNGYRAVFPRVTSIWERSPILLNLMSNRFTFDRWDGFQIRFLEPKVNVTIGNDRWHKSHKGMMTRIGDIHDHCKPLDKLRLGSQFFFKYFRRISRRTTEQSDDGTN